MKAAAGIVGLFSLLVSCASPKEAVRQDVFPETLKTPPAVSVPAYQEVFYNGEAQPLEAAGDGAPLALTYFSSEELLLRDEGGSAEAPVEVGRYFVRIERPEGNGFSRGREQVVEYRIKKAPVNIIARAVQEFRGDGREKPILASADVPVTLIIVYYDANRTGTAAQTRDPAAGIALALPGPPSAPGSYLVRVSFPGDSHYLEALKDVQLIIR
ncbi:MAG: hypothetical protein LBL70_01480 [Treponema sp.]|jgi:hypothetical protein|nr:hypothetical protein [Treponema sp.]